VEGEAEVLLVVCFILTVGVNHRWSFLKTEEKEGKEEKTTMRTILFHHHCVDY